MSRVFPPRPNPAQSVKNQLFWIIAALVVGVSIFSMGVFSLYQTLDVRRGEVAVVGDRFSSFAQQS